MERGASEWRSGTLRKEQGIKKEARGSSRATSQSCSSFSEGRAFTCRTTSVGIAALRRVVGWQGGRAELQPRQSGRDETVRIPGVRIGATSTDASSASEDVSQSVKTRLLRSGTAPRFSNVGIRGSPASGEMAFYQIASRILRLAGLSPTASPLCYSVSTCEGTPKIRTNIIRHPISKIYNFATDGSQETAHGCSRHGKRSRGTLPRNHAHVQFCIAKEPEVYLRAESLRGAPGPPAEAFG
jgi:hypothetical protein